MKLFSLRSALIAAAASATLATALAQQAPGMSPLPPKPAMATEGGHGMRGMHGGGHGMGMLSRGLPERLLWAIDATPEQRTKLKALNDAFQADMKPLQEQMRTQRQGSMSLFSAATLDRAAIEKQRTDHAALQERMSKRVVAYMTDSAEVLTPAQRAKIAQHLKSRMEGRNQRG